MFQMHSTEAPAAVHAEQHRPVAYWAKLWGFSSKTIREWFRDEHGPGILRVANLNRRTKRDYTSLMISPTAAARVYEGRTRKVAPAKREVM